MIKVIRRRSRDADVRLDAIRRRWCVVTRTVDSIRVVEFELLTACWNDKTVVWRLASNEFESGYGLQEFIAYLLDGMGERFNEPSPLRGLPGSTNRSEMVSVRRTEISRFVPDVYIMSSIFNMRSNTECQRGALSASSLDTLRIFRYLDRTACWRSLKRVKKRESNWAVRLQQLELAAGRGAHFLPVASPLHDHR